MSEQDYPKEEAAQGSNPTELDALKSRADLMGIKYHPNIGLDTLKVKVADKMSPPKVSPEELATIGDAEVAAQADTFTPLKRETPAQIIAAKKKDALRLVRIRVTNMDPIEANLKGRIMSVGNAQIGFIKKFVPFNSEVGYHVPNILLKALQSKKYMAHYTIKKGNKTINRNKLIPQYAIEILPPLTAQEMGELKQRQLMAAGAGL